MIERDFDIPFVSEMALREKQIQQNYRPIIGVHKWFARRPGTTFRALLLAEFAQGPLRGNYFRSHNLEGLRIGDPFMGGGTPLLEANRLGCDVVGYDINPMAYWIVQQEIASLDLAAYLTAARRLTDLLEQRVGAFYRTRCLYCGCNDVSAKYYLWVKTSLCKYCGGHIDLFPGYLLSEDRRHPKNVFVCPKCGELTEADSRKEPGACRLCGAPLMQQGPAKNNRCACPHCHIVNSYPDTAAGRPEHRMFAIEYHCHHCSPKHAGRFFKKPDAEDLARYALATSMWTQTNAHYVPGDAIPSGDETDRLHKWGYRHYQDMFNARQLLGLDLSCNVIATQKDELVRNALATNLSDLLRYQNMLCRYDTMALKSLDIFSVHGFPVGLIQCESNLIGIYRIDGRTNVGSGGWFNIIDKYRKAKQYCSYPFEVMHRDGKKVVMPTPDEWIGERRHTNIGLESRVVELHCGSATLSDVPEASLDAVLTDPPYFGNVQYAELMDFCYVWLKKLVGADNEAFHAVNTRNSLELTGNVTMKRGLTHFSEGMSEVFRRMAQALKKGGPLAFTYHHNSLEAYYPVAVAILDAGLTCSASIPCPAEMSASIHISGTGSSIVDTIFVCRLTGTVPRRWIATSVEQMARLVCDDIAHLSAAGVVVTHGDIRCIVFGHLVRMAVWELRRCWQEDALVSHKLTCVADHIQRTGGASAVEQYVHRELWDTHAVQPRLVREQVDLYQSESDDISY